MYFIYHRCHQRKLEIVFEYVHKENQPLGRELILPPTKFLFTTSRGRKCCFNIILIAIFIV